ncbi:MAG: hypothetical protein JKY37_11125 [Nannocystaceae bacterium]|nr:hypothetical protein [Nannocystaceae bacterium]
MLLAVLTGFGCITRPPVPPPNPVYAVWQLETAAQLQTMLDVKSCEHWRVVELLVRDKKLVLVLVHDGPATVDPACRS